MKTEHNKYFTFEQSNYALSFFQISKDHIHLQFYMLDIVTYNTANTTNIDR